MNHRNLNIHQAEMILNEWASDNRRVFFSYSVGKVQSQFFGELKLGHSNCFVHVAGPATHCLFPAEYTTIFFAEEGDAEAIVFKNVKDTDSPIDAACILRMRSEVLDWGKFPLLSELIQ